MSIGRRLFDYDPISGMTTWFTYDPDTKTSVLQYEQDCAPTLDVTKAMQKDADYSKRGIKRDWWHYGHFPDAIIVKMLTEEGINIYSGDPEHIARAFAYINRPEYRYLKTTEGNHQPSFHD